MAPPNIRFFGPHPKHPIGYGIPTSKCGVAKYPGGRFSGHPTINAVSLAALSALVNQNAVSPDIRFSGCSNASANEGTVFQGDDVFLQGLSALFMGRRFTEYPIFQVICHDTIKRSFR